MAFEPKPGLVIRYDFLWKEDRDAGREEGKDRPCAIILMSKAREDGSIRVFVCPVTHTPPSTGQTAVEIPYKVARHLKLDDDRMWIRTNQLNEFNWVPGHHPHGVISTVDGRVSYGMLPHALGKAAYVQVQMNNKSRKVHRIDREVDD